MEKFKPSPQQLNADNNAISRRDFLKKSALGAAGLILASNGILPKETHAKENNEDEQRLSLFNELKENGLEVDDNFSILELKDILEVATALKEEIGDLTRFNFEIKKKFNKSRFDHPNNKSSILCDESPLKGYSSRGSTSPTTHIINIAPADIINKTDEWERKNNKRPFGEEQRAHDFKNVLAHELAHALSFKLEFGYELMRVENNNPKTAFAKKWLALDGEISKILGAELGNKDHEWENRRPLGLPTKYCYFGTSGRGSNHERFAETTAYYLTKSEYANMDKFLLKRVELIKELFTEIKKNNFNNIIHPPFENFKN